MDRRPEDGSESEEINCPSCTPRGKALVGNAEEGRQRRIKCRKCDAEYWGNQAIGRIQGDIDNL